MECLPLKGPPSCRIAPHIPPQSSLGTPATFLWPCHSFNSKINFVPRAVTGQEKKHSPQAVAPSQSLVSLACRSALGQRGRFLAGIHGECRGSVYSGHHQPGAQMR